MLLYWRHYIAYQATSLVFRAVFFNQGALAPWGTASTGHKLPSISIMSWHDECGQATSTIITNDALGPGPMASFVVMMIATDSSTPWQCRSLIQGRQQAGSPTAIRRRQKLTSFRSPPSPTLCCSARAKRSDSDVGALWWRGSMWPGGSVIGGLCNRGTYGDGGLSCDG